MAKTANVYARIEPNIKEQAEQILATLGIPASNAINMFYKQIILQQGIPFDLKVPQYTVTNVDDLTDEEVNVELSKGYDDLLAGRTKSAKSFFSDIRKDYNL